MLLSVYEQKLQKKGIKNLSKDELFKWIEVCKRCEKDVKFKKARRIWHESRKEAEERLVLYDEKTNQE